MTEKKSYWKRSQTEMRTMLLKDVKNSYWNKVAKDLVACVL
jgi:hypothetical protein